jgi:hypothetical protein
MTGKVAIVVVGADGGVRDQRARHLRRARNTAAGYDAVREAIARIRGNIPQGDPEATGAALLAVIDAVEPPLAVFFGTSGLLMMRPDYAQRIETWERWDHIALQAQGDLPAK